MPGIEDPDPERLEHGAQELHIRAPHGGAGRIRGPQLRQDLPMRCGPCGGGQLIQYLGDRPQWGLRHHEPVTARGREREAPHPQVGRDRRPRRLRVVGIVGRGPEDRGSRDPRVPLDPIGERKRRERLQPGVERTTEEPGLLTGRDDDPACRGDPCEPVGSRAARRERRAQRLVPPTGREAFPHARPMGAPRLHAPRGRRAPLGRDRPTLDGTRQRAAPKCLGDHAWGAHL